MPDERETIARAQAGNRVAFNQLVIRHQDQVYTLCFRLTGNAEDAADATQEAFLSAFKHVADYRGGAFTAWLLRIASNACHDLHRYRKRRPAASLDASPDGGAEDESASRDIPDESPGPETETLRGELTGVLQQGLLALPEDQRLAVVLCDQYGYDYQSIADLTDAELGTVKSRINRARRKMRDFLHPHRELLPDRYRLSDSGQRPD
ncbi:MAG: RNA polymerase sigma factor [Chloroflexota bacterium]